MEELSLARLVAQRAFVSRRQAACLIKENRVEVDGKLCDSIGHKVHIQVRLRVNGELLPSNDLARRVLLYHKPVGELSSQVSQNNKPTVFSSLPPCEYGKWIMVGRLDINSSGLLLFTNDGELAYRLMNPLYKLDREYIARVKGRRAATLADLNSLTRGVYLDGRLARFNDIVPMHDKSIYKGTKRTNGRSASPNEYFYLVVQEGRNRLVRRLWEKQGFQVSRLIRIRFANIVLPRSLNAGKHCLLNKQDRRRLAACVKL